MNDPNNVVKVLQALQALLDPGSPVVTLELDPRSRPHVARLEYRFTEPAHVSDDEMQTRSGSVVSSLLSMD